MNMVMRGTRYLNVKNFGKWTTPRSYTDTLEIRRDQLNNQDHFAEFERYLIGRGVGKSFAKKLNGILKHFYEQDQNPVLFIDTHYTGPKNGRILEHWTLAQVPAGNNPQRPANPQHIYMRPGPAWVRHSILNPLVYIPVGTGAAGLIGYSLLHGHEGPELKTNRAYVAKTIEQQEKYRLSYGNFNGEDFFMRLHEFDDKNKDGVLQSKEISKKGKTVLVERGKFDDGKKTLQQWIDEGRTPIVMIRKYEPVKTDGYRIRGISPVSSAFLRYDKDGNYFIVPEERIDVLKIHEAQIPVEGSQIKTVETMKKTSQ